MTKEEMWNEYIKIDHNAIAYQAWAFGGNNPDLLASLVLKKVKTATASAFPLYVYESEPLPLVGEYNIILNSKQEAVCIIKTTKVYTIPFKYVSEDHAYKEGEGKRSLEEWRECHSKFFKKELEEIKSNFNENTLVVCEEFEVVYPFK